MVALRVLLLTEDTVLWIARGGASVAQAAVHFGGSVQMVNYRLNITGAREHMTRAPEPRIVEESSPGDLSRRIE